MNRSDDHRWALVLAGGSGTRLASMTIDGNGVAVPKQYCALAGERSLLGDTLARARMLVDGERTVVVVAREHEAFWSRQLPSCAPPHIVSSRRTAARRQACSCRCSRSCAEIPQHKSRCCRAITLWPTKTCWHGRSASRRTRLRRSRDACCSSVSCRTVLIRSTAGSCRRPDPARRSTSARSSRSRTSQLLSR